MTVLELAANKIELDIKWYDKRQAVSEATLDSEGLVGVIANAKLFFGRHWFSLRCFGGTWCNLD